jgi:FkbM family methyltransferase
LDIGSNAGIYSYYFSRKFSKIDAFEPLKEVTYRLEALGGKNTRIHNVALSDKRGTLPIHIPAVNGHPIATRASLEVMGCDCEVRNVDVVTLDQYGFIDVDLVKIDVEGHEYAVLDGAINTLTLCKPII